jgi:formamidopyrimidine-DNA glycosylase
MPELPEVQTVVNQLGKKIVGKQFKSFSSEWPKQVKPGIAKLRRALQGATVLGTRRFGKHIVIDLDTKYSLVVHLKMTGHLLYKDEGNAASPAWRDPVNQYIRHRFLFSDGAQLDFSDMRKFGWIDYEESAALAHHQAIVGLGRDALAEDCDEDFFLDLLRRARGKRIAPLLLEQEKIAGIGNIYRSEMLFRAGIRPSRRIASLSREERLCLFVKMKEVLREAVRLRGTSDGDFRDTAGRPGGFQKTLFVYQREGLPCKRCGTIVVRQKIGQRSVFYCPNCQT